MQTLISLHGLIFLIIATIARFVVGMLWYSPVLFGKPWLKAHGKGADFKPKGAGKELTVAFVFGLISTIVLALFVVNPIANNVLIGIVVALLMWVGFVLPAHVYKHIFAMPEKKPSLTIFFIDATQELAALIVAAIILSFI
jgi:hypothetical protein